MDILSMMCLQHHPKKAAKDCCCRLNVFFLFPRKNHHLQVVNARNGQGRLAVLVATVCQLK